MCVQLRQKAALGVLATSSVVPPPRGTIKPDPFGMEGGQHLGGD